MSSASGNRSRPPIVTFVGNSGVGKTTFLEQLIPVLKARGYRLAIIKHHGHDFQFDYPGKDTWRFTEAGGDIVVISSPVKLGLVEQVSGHERSLEEIAAIVGERVDLVLAEGYRQEGMPAIEVYRQAVSPQLISDPSRLLAIISEEPLDTPGLEVPQFWRNAASAVADLLERRFGLKPAQPPSEPESATPNG